MIRYSLRCKKNHEFESWFASSEAFDKLAAKRQVACPECGSKSVEKALMAPRVVKSEAKSPSKRAAKAAAKRAVAAASTTTTSTSTPDPPVPSLQHVAAQKELIEAVRKLRDEVVSKAEYVGPRFSEEARKIHYEEAPARGIYGEATAEEARALLEEGVEVMPLPVLPDDKN